MGFRFTAMHPFDESQFESVVLPLGGKFGRGMGARDDGTQFPVQLLETKTGVIIYSAPTGLLTFESPSLSETLSLIERVLTPLMQVASIHENDLAYAESTVIFIVPTPSTALRHIEPALGETPIWAHDFAGVPMRHWGLRFIPKSASEFKAPLKSLTPWHELTIEPFADNPKNVFIRVLTRVESWNDLRARLERLPTNVEAILEEMGES